MGVAHLAKQLFHRTLAGGAHRFRNRVLPSACGYLLLLACQSGKNQDETLLARVYDKVLTISDIDGLVPYGTPAQDSLRLVEDFVSEWIKRTLVYVKAENNLAPEQKEVSRQLEDYRRSLLIYAYEQELIRQQVDTLVSEEEISAYYRNNPGNFELKKNIIRLKYVKVPLGAPNIDKAKQWVQGKSEADFEKLEQYCRLHASNYLLNDQLWLLLDDVLKEIPIQDYNIDQFNRGKRFLELNDANFRYYVLVQGFMLKNSQSPLSFERNNIRNIIIYKRKLDLIKQMQADIYNDALNENEIEIKGKTLR